MTKILFIGHLLEASAWGAANQNFVLALDKAGIDVVPRAIRLGKPAQEVPDKIKELLRKPSAGCDVCIQWVLPHHYVYNGNFKKNIGYLILEHHGLKLTDWCRHINLMDELWVPSKETIEYAEEDGITKPMHYVPHAFDFNVYNNVYQKVPELSSKTFKFYFIGELHRRKHLASLLRAFHNEFHSNEPVDLVLKLGKAGASPEETLQETRTICQQVKETLRLYSEPRMYKNEIIIANRLSDEDIYRIHCSCDCYVTSTYGEAFNMPAFDAMMFGNTPICTDCGAMRDYIEHNRNGMLVKAEKESIIGLTEMFDGIGTGREWWWNINGLELQKSMRAVYQAAGKINKRLNREYSLERAKKVFSYEAVAQRVGELLNA